MQSYYKPKTWIVRQWRVRINGRLYQGRGILTWNSEEGYRLIGFPDSVEPQVPLCPNPNEFILMQRYIWLRPEGGGFFILPSLLDENWKYLDVRSSCAWLCSSRPMPEGIEDVAGTGLYAFGGRYLGDKEVATVKQLDGKLVQESFNAQGFHFEDGSFVLRGELNDGELSLSWWLRNSRKRSLAWRLGESISMAVSLMTGWTVPLLQRSARFNQREWSAQYIKNTSALDAYQILPINNNRSDDLRLESRIIARLALFLAQPTIQAHVFRTFCRKASQERDLATRQFFLSSSVEAILKTLSLATVQNKPREFRSLRNRQFQTENEIEYYCKANLTYFDDREIELIRQSWRRLRHAHAHPDWFIDKNVESTSELEQAIIDEKRLCAFLGHILNGFCPGLPRFHIRGISSWGRGPILLAKENGIS